jgi:hypothetical protein
MLGQDPLDFAASDRERRAFDVAGMVFLDLNGQNNLVSRASSCRS